MDRKNGAQATTQGDPDTDSTLARQRGSTTDRAELGLEWQSTQLLLWMLGCMAGLPDTALAGLGLDTSAVGELRSQHAGDIEQMRRLQVLGRQFDRRRISELLRVRVSGMALAARTPTELVAVARTVRALPDWVWEDAVQRADGPAAPKTQAGPGSAAQFNAAGTLADWQSAVPSTALVDSLPLNRQQRRTLDAQLRKGR